MHTVLEITGALGLDTPADIQGHHLLRRMEDGKIRTFREIYSHLAVEPGSLLTGEAPRRLQASWTMDGDPRNDTEYVA